MFSGNIRMLMGLSSRPPFSFPPFYNPSLAVVFLRAILLKIQRAFKWLAYVTRHICLGPDTS